MKFSKQNTADYAISEQDSPEMKNITMCFWVKTEQKKGFAHYISYAVKGADNQILVYHQTHLRLQIWHRGSRPWQVSSAYKYVHPDIFNIDGRLCIHDDVFRLYVGRLYIHDGVTIYTYSNNMHKLRDIFWHLIAERSNSYF